MNRNPLCNADQFAAEDEVRAMWDMPVIRDARAHAAQLWRVAYGEDVPAEAWAAFETAMDEYVANYLFKAAACDPAYPRFVRNFMAAHDGPGGPVPGARMGGDNVDNCYRLAAIAHGAGYVVRIMPVGVPPAHVSFTLVGNWGTSVTIQTIEYYDLERADDGSAAITIDDRPADGRRNHMMTAPNVKFLFVRDTMADWATETPLDLAIERVAGLPTAPLSIEEKAARAAFRLIEEVPLYYWFTRLFSARPINTLTDPGAVTGVGGLMKQASAMGRLQLKPDQAAIIRYDPAGAAYCALALHNWWFQSIDAGDRQSSLTAAMSHVGADGWVTCVACARDPGIVNWIDTTGLRDTLPLIRWQGLPGTSVRDGPRADMRIVAFDRLEGELPAGVERLDAEGRGGDLAARVVAYRRRLVG